MHGSLADNRVLLEAVRAGVKPGGSTKCAVCVPFPYLFQARDALSGSPIFWGGQDVSEHPKGAYTGEVSASMLHDLGCRYVLVGHSERRQMHGEDNALVARKFRAARGAGLTPVLCVGETLDQREEGATQQVVAAQLDAVIELLGVAALRSAVVAYEPVWAIGTGRTATPEQAQAVHGDLRARVSALDAAVGEDLPIVYGGSVKASNAAELFAMPDIDGGLVGGASLDAGEFLAIVAAAGQ